MPYVTINISEHPERVQEMFEVTQGKRSVPQIFFNSEYIGGAEAFFKKLKSETLMSEIEEMLEVLDFLPRIVGTSSNCTGTVPGLSDPSN